MHRFFEPLSEREAMLLMTTLVVGGKSDVALFKFLDGDVQRRLEEKASALAEIPSKKRVSFMVREMKQAFKFRGLRGLERVDPSWLVSMMRGESPRIVGVILMTLPPPVVRSVLKRLPEGVRKKLPPKEELRKAPVELVRSVRQIFESHFARMPEISGQILQFSAVLTLERKELYALMRDLGLSELGQAFGAVGRLALAELCRRLDRISAHELITAVKALSAVNVPDLKTAQHFLSRVVVNFNDAEDLFRKAGLWQIAKASSTQDVHFCDAFKQHLPREVSRLFEDYVRTAGSWEKLDEARVLEIQDHIVGRIKILSAQGRLNARWSHQQVGFHDPDYLLKIDYVSASSEGQESVDSLDEQEAFTEDAE
jgi:hypothetical protein